LFSWDFFWLERLRFNLISDLPAPTADAAAAGRASGGDFGFDVFSLSFVKKRVDMAGTSCQSGRDLESPHFVAGFAQTRVARKNRAQPFSYPAVLGRLFY
jgi:hypothetical protein